MEFAVNYIFLPILILTIIIFVHELGHFMMARFFNFKTPVFSVGFGKEIIGYSDKQGTRWKLSIFPLGGYVSIDSSESDPLYQRVWIALAGPLANFIFAILLTIILGLSYGSPKTPPDIVALNLSAGAYAAGIMPRDKILSIDGVSIPYYIDEIKEMVAKAKNDNIIAEIERNGKILSFSIPVKNTNRTGDFGENQEQKIMGVVFAGQNLKLSAINNVAGVNTKDNLALARSEIIKHMGKNIVLNFGKGTEHENFLTYIDPALNKDLLDEHSAKYSSLILWDDKLTKFMPIPFWESVGDAFELAYQACKKTIGVLWQIIVGKKGAGDLGGVVAISTMTGEVAEQAKFVGAYFIFRLMAILSISIGFINLFPLPMFDGGHLAFYAIEGVRGRPPSPKVKGYIYGVGIMFIIILSLFVTYRDIMERIPH